MGKEVLIWGAGKIGRGFVAEIFSQGGYDLTFVDASKELVEELNQAGSYPVVKAPTATEPETIEIGGYEAFHLSETEAIDTLLARVPYVAVVLFPDVFADFARDIARGLERRANAGQEPLDLILCANVSGAAGTLSPLIREQLSAEARGYFDERVGLVETVIIRIGVPTPHRFEHLGPLAVTTNGFPYMPVSRPAFRGAVPNLPMLRPIDNIEAEETRKYFTYNMVHAVYAYAGFMRGHETVLEAAADPLIEGEAKGALEEASRALQAEYGFTKEEMEQWSREVFANLQNPLIEDTLARVGRDPRRKLRRGERLVGPALLCKKHGVFPHYLTKAIARAFFFNPPGDEGAEVVRGLLRKEGVFGALTELGELDRDPEIAALAKDHLERLQQDPDAEEDPERLALRRKAYETGFGQEILLEEDALGNGSP